MKMSDILINFDAIGLKFGWRIVFGTVHQCFKFRSGRTRNERRICVLNSCLKLLEARAHNLLEPGQW